MNWRRVTRLLRARAGARPSRHELYRPSFASLEERTLLSTVVFMIRPSLAAITVAPSLDGGGLSIPFTEQGPGSLTTGYVGRMKTDLNLTNNTIQFFAAGTIIGARNSGNWQPDVNGAPGASPANYGGKSDIVGTNNIALRDVRVTLSSPLIPLTPIGNGMYTFPADEDVDFAQGNLDYDLQFLGIGSGRTSFTDSTPNNSPSLGTLQVNPGGGKQISVPVNGTIFAGVVNGFAIKVKFDGAIGGFAPAGSGRAIDQPRLGAGIVNLDGNAAAPRRLADTAFVDTISSRRDHRLSELAADVTPAQDQESTTVTPNVHYASTGTPDVNPVFGPIFVDPARA